jgi:endopeptidase Clp ATP-binding regulatory subunit ClpX
MSDDNTTNLPSHQDIEKDISDYLSKKYGDRVKIIGFHAQPELEIDSTITTEPPTDKKIPYIDFDVKPEDLCAYLDEYVIRQDESKAILSTKICTHFNRIKNAIDNPLQAKRTVGQIKNNVLLIGPTGVGKTFLIKLIARRLGVPFIKGDATKFSETGYVGGDVDDLVRDLVREAGDDIESAQYGIIYIDEIDKIASARNLIGADVSRSGVQRALLKPMEETEVDLKVPHDPISQIEAIEHYRATGKRQRRIINTKDILFIMSGAFTELDDIIKKRIQKQAIGFEGDISSKKKSGRYLKHVKAEDLIGYGFESEFIGRLPVIASLDSLSVNDLYEILLNPNSSVVVGKKLDFLAYGIRIQFSDEALKEIARKAVQEQTGARGLVSIMDYGYQVSFYYSGTGK